MIIEDRKIYDFNKMKSSGDYDNKIRLIVEKPIDHNVLNAINENLINDSTEVTIVLGTRHDPSIKLSDFDIFRKNVLCIESYSVDLENIDGISAFQNLHKLVLENLYPKDFDISELLEINSIEYLSILYNPLSVTQHKIISQIKSLKRLKAAGLDSDLLTTLPDLEELEIFNLMNGKDLYLKTPNLKTLTIRKASKKADCNFLIGLKCLTSLGLDGLSNVIELPDLSSLSSLIRLSLINFKRLEKFPQLSKSIEYLYLSGNFSMLSEKELSKLIPVTFPSLKEIIVNIGAVRKSQAILNRFENICNAHIY